MSGSPLPNLKLTISPQDLQAILDKVGGIAGGARTVLYTALNKTAAHARTLIARDLAAEMTAKIGLINKRITVKKGTGNSLAAQIDLHGEHGVSLIGFSAKQTPEGVMAHIFGKSKSYPHAFIRPGVAGGKQVFLRQGRSRVMQKGRYKGHMRQPVIALKGPTVPETFEKTPNLAAKDMADIKETLAKNITSQISWLLQRGQPQKDD